MKDCRVNTMKRWQQWLTLSAMLLALMACGGGGGDRASGIQSGPTEPGQPVTPPSPVLPADSVAVTDLDSSATLSADISDISFNSPLTVRFAVSVNGQSVSGLTSSNVRFSLARLEPNAGFAKGEHWVSYINRNEDPVCRSSADVSSANNQCTTFTSATDPALIEDSARKVQDVQATGKVAVSQANTENNGTLTANADGSFNYVFSTDPGDPATLTTVHRVCIQFSLPASVDNACIDFVPSVLADSATASIGSSLHGNFYNTYSARQIATEATCNTCHAKLALHGGGRTQMEYCVTCHNPGTNDANSGNSLDLKVMVHKLHNGRNLPSKTMDSLAYKIWGFSNAAHDYGELSYPQSMTNCTRCHAGQEDIDFANAQGLPLPTAQITADGHNWVTNPTLSVCTACHEKLVTANLKMDGTTPSYDHTAFTEETDCAGCHRDQGATSPGGLQANMAHRDLLDEAGRNVHVQIEAITNTAAGQQPLIDFTVRDRNDVAINIQDALAFCPGTTFDVRIPWDSAGEYLNVDALGQPDSSPRLRGGKTPAEVLALGGNVFRIDTATLSTTLPIPAGIDSLAVMMDTYYKEDCNDANTDYVRLNGVVKYAPVTATGASPRREIVSIDTCANCHGRLFTFTFDAGVHGGRRGVNAPEICAACHNPARSSSSAGSMSHDLGTMTHAVHASAMRETPYKDKYDETALQFPGDLANCATCHVGDSYTVPLPLERVPMLSNSSVPGVYTTPLTAICSSCHDGAVAKAHMESAGGGLIDVPLDTANAATETCAICHGEGAAAAVDVVHGG